MSDIFIVKVSHKSYHFVRTESRFFEISESEILSNGPVVNAVSTPDSTVADLVAQGEREKQKTKGKASKIRRFQKEVV
jgi:hypothetical protein